MMPLGSPGDSLTHPESDSGEEEVINMTLAEAANKEEVSKMTDDMERYQCAECGHLHWVEAVKEYDDCPICDCEGQ